jgi:hypothetical protein
MLQCSRHRGLASLGDLLVYNSQPFQACGADHSRESGRELRCHLLEVRGERKGAAAKVFPAQACLTNP